MKKFIIREDVAKSVRETLDICRERYDEDYEEDNTLLSSQWIKDVLYEFDTGLCILSPRMPTHVDLQLKDWPEDGDCRGSFTELDDRNMVICNGCGMTINDAIRELKKGEK